MTRAVPKSGAMFEICHFFSFTWKIHQVALQIIPAAFLHGSYALGFFPVILDCLSHYLPPSIPLLSGSGESFVGGSWALRGKYTSLGDANERSCYR